MTLKLQKRKLHIKLSFLLAAGLYSFTVQAQVVVNLPQANITARTDYQENFAAGQYSSVINLFPTVSAKANTTNFNNTLGGNGPAPLNLAHVKIVSIGNVSLIGISNEITLSTAYQVMASALANLLSGPVIGGLRLTTSSFTWVAGTYTSELALLAPGLLGIGNRISPATQSLQLVVPAFITPQNSAGTTSVFVNNLSYYRTPNGISSNKVITIAHTVPYIPSLETGNSNFSFSTNLAYNSSPISPVSSVSATLTAVPTATPITLSATTQALTNATGLVVPTNNSQALTHAFSINAAQLTTHFVQAGTYTVPLTYTWNKLSSAYPAGGLQAQSVGSLEVEVSDMSELIANQQEVNLTFSTANHYKNGVNQDMPAHLTLSKTTPYDLYVRATTPDFASGVNSIPIDVMRIGPMSGETGMQTVTLSTTPQQLINAADPVIDRSLSVRYSIPATETSKLLNKPAGTYATHIIFSFVAP